MNRGPEPAPTIVEEEFDNSTHLNRGPEPAPTMKDTEMPYPTRGTNELRKGRRSVPGRIYFVTKSITKRIDSGEIATECVLTAEDIPQIITRSLQWLHEQRYIDLLAYVIMPDHVHFAFRLLEKDTLSAIMHRFGSYIGRAITIKLAYPQSIWEPGYYERAIPDESKLDLVYEYIASNPVKAGYVAQPSEWTWLYIAQHR